MNLQIKRFGIRRVVRVLGRFFVLGDRYIMVSAGEPEPSMVTRKAAWDQTWKRLLAAPKPQAAAEKSDQKEVVNDRRN